MVAKNRRPGGPKKGVAPVEPQDVGRRLTTILVADVVGYSRLMGADGAGTVAALEAHRKESIEPKPALHHGRSVKLMGDGSPMEFGIWGVVPDLRGVATAFNFIENLRSSGAPTPTAAEARGKPHSLYTGMTTDRAGLSVFRISKGLGCKQGR